MRKRRTRGVWSGVGLVTLAGIAGAAAHGPTGPDSWEEGTHTWVGSLYLQHLYLTSFEHVEVVDFRRSAPRGEWQRVCGTEGRTDYDLLRPGSAGGTGSASPV